MKSKTKLIITLAVSALMLALLISLCACGSGKASGFRAYNNLANYGRVAYMDKYTYFINTGVNNDGSQNGNVYSEDFYRVANKKDAEPELLYSIPSVLKYGEASSYALNLVSGGGRLYYTFTTREGLNELRWISENGKKSGVIEGLNVYSSFRFLGFFAEDGVIYLLNYDAEVVTEENYIEAFQWKKVDMKTGKVSDYKPSFIKEGDFPIIKGVDSGYVYYVLYYAEEDRYDNGLYRGKINGKSSEGILDLEANNIDPDDDFLMVRGNYIWTKIYDRDQEDDLLTRISIDTGKLDSTAAVKDIGTMNFDDDGNVWVIGDDDKNVYKVDKDTLESALIASSDTNKYNIYISGDRYYFLAGESEMYSAELTSRICPTRPLVPDPQWKTVKNDEWEISTIGNKCKVVAYLGSGEKVTVPAEIEGYKVIYVDPLYLNEAVTELTVSEGIKGVSIVGGANVAKITLPKSLVSVFAGEKYFLRYCPKLEQVVFGGSADAWTEMGERSEAQYDSSFRYPEFRSWLESNTGYKVKTSDGQVHVSYE